MISTNEGMERIYYSKIGYGGGVDTGEVRFMCMKGSPNVKSRESCNVETEKPSERMDHEIWCNAYGFSVSERKVA